MLIFHFKKTNSFLKLQIASKKYLFVLFHSEIHEILQKYFSRMELNSESLIETFFTLSKSETEYIYCIHYNLEDAEF